MPSGVPGVGSPRLRFVTPLRFLLAVPYLLFVLPLSVSAGRRSILL